MGTPESATPIAGILGFLVHVALVYALTAWGRRIAARRGTRAWRLASYMPIVGFLAAMVGLLGTILGLIRAFGSVGHENASQRAQALADGIRGAMSATAIGLTLALVLYLASVLTFLNGSYGAGARRDTTR